MERGFVVVPVDGATDTDPVRVRFKHVSVAPGGGPQRDCIVIFSSQDTFTDSGLPIHTPCATPVPIDLAGVVGPDRWIALDPGTEDVACMPLGAFIGLWNQIALAGRR